MNRMFSAVTNHRFLKWVALPHALFIAVAWWTEAHDLIGILNPIDIALSVAVCIAFLPSLVDTIWGSRPIDSAAFMVAGVFLGWESNALRSVWSMVWRGLGAPEWLANTDFTSYVLFILGYGAVCHLLAPGAIGENVPRARWVKVGAWVGVGIFAAISVAHRDDVAAAIEWFHPPHDDAAQPPPTPRRGRDTPAPRQD